MVLSMEEEKKNSKLYTVCRAYKDHTDVYEETEEEFMQTVKRLHLIANTKHGKRYWHSVRSNDRQIFAWRKRDAVNVNK